MKTKEKNPPNKVRIHPVRRCFGWSIRLLLLVVLLVFATLAWLTWFGLPRSILDDFRERAAREGLYFDAQRVRLDVTRGVVGEGWSWYLDERDVAPILEAGEVVLELSFMDLLDKDKRVSGLSFSRGRLFADIGALSGDDSHTLLIDQLNGMISLLPGKVRIRSLTGIYDAFAIRGRGDVVLKVRKPRPNDAGPPVQKTDRVAGEPAIKLEGMQSTLKALCSLVAELEEVNFSRRAAADFYFHVDENDDDANHFTLNARSNGKCWVRGYAYDDVKLEVKSENQTIELLHFQMLQAERKLRVSGTLRSRESRVDAKVYADLESECLFSLMPGSLRRFFSRQGFECQGGMNVDLAFVDAPLEQMSDAVSGWVSFDHGSYKTMPIPRMRFHLDRQAPMLVASKLDAVFGEGSDAGPIKGTYTRNDQDQTYHGDFTTAFMPRVLLPIVSKGVAHTITFAEFKGANPEIDIRLSGSDHDAAAFRSDLTLNSSDALYKGIKFQTMQLHAAYSNQVLHINDLHLLRPEGVVTGRVHQLYSQGMAFLDLESSIDPAALAQVVGPSATRLVKLVKFIGNSKLNVHGMVDYQTGRRNSMHGRLHVEDAWYKKYHIRGADFFWTATSNVFTVADFSGEVSGGQLGGFFQITDLNNQKSQMFHLRVNGKDVDMQQVAQRDERVGDKPYSGRLSGDLMLSGLFNDEGYGSYAGSGQINIKEGELFKFPIFGGLSGFLSKIVPGFGYSLQSDFSAPFTVANRRFSSDAINLKGNMLTISGRGSMNFDHALDFKVQVRLLKEGLVAEALQLITWPISKLLEFKLTGTTEQPDWRPDNLPKELFLQFD
ncbi:MAG: hypothetical protein ACI9TH_000289 [Kiritimatiellia bacterium]